MKVNVYMGSFVTKDGSLRKMLFSRLNELPTSFYSSMLKGIEKHNLEKGMERVWDWERADFRTFNFSKQVGQLSVVEIKEI